MWSNLLIFTFTLCILHANCSVYYDPENEAVVIDDTIIFDPSTPVAPAPGHEKPEGYCQTISGAEGRCIPLNECYPYADELYEDENSVFGNYILELINSTELCSEENGNVCCPNYAYEKLPYKKPAVLPQYPKPTTGKPATATKNETNEEEESGESCGSSIVYTDDSVVGGYDSKKGQFPWAVAITNGGRQFCGGSVISESYILTAAHCVQSIRDASGLRVLLGAHNLNLQSETERQSRGVSKILYHKDFTMQHLRNDVALIKLSSPVKYTKFIQPICLNSDKLNYTEKVDLAGWGKTSNSGPPSKILKTVRMSLISPEKCKKTYQNSGAPQLTEGMICAGEKSPLKDACNGDSGGPLTLKGTGEEGAKQVGIVSWGIGCGEKPGVYAKVSHYLPWIKRNSK